MLKSSMTIIDIQIIIIDAYFKETTLSKSIFSIVTPEIIDVIKKSGGRLLDSVDIFDDTLLSTAYELDNITSPNIKDNVISIDYDSPLKDSNIVELDISGYVNKVEKNKS